MAAGLLVESGAYVRLRVWQTSLLARLQPGFEPLHTANIRVVPDGYNLNRPCSQHFSVIDEFAALRIASPVRALPPTILKLAVRISLLCSNI